MAIVEAELKLYKSATVSDAAANGGRLSSTEITTAIKNNIFPDVTQAQRTAGVTQYRKVFYKVGNDDDLTLEDSLVHLAQTTAGDDYVALFAGTQRNTQADIGTPTYYAVGTLQTNVSAGGTSLVMVLEADFVGIRTGDSIYITNGTSSEYHDNVTVVKAGVNVTITLDSGDTLENSFLSATPTYIAACIDAGDIECSSDNYTDTEGDDTSFDFTTYPLELDNIGTIEQTWTLTVLAGGATFTLEGDTLGEVATGIAMSSNYAPSNAAFIKPYFTLDKDGWSGALAGGEIVTFQTHPAAYPVWIRRVTPAGSGVQALNTFKINLKGESA